MNNSKEGFASRWSRLKREPGDEPEQLEQSEQPAEITEAQGPAETPVEELTDAELLEKLGLPDPDLMKSGDNFSAFMNHAVPDRLRRRALRVLWGSNPILANLDELVDYGDDFTDAATVVENMQTIYRVGQGSAWKYREEQARIAEAKAIAEAEDAERRAHNGEPEPETETEAETLVVDADPEPETSAEDAPEPEYAALAHDAPPELAPVPPRPRAMRFGFDEGEPA